jgi:hypothetical protein
MSASSAINLDRANDRDRQTSEGRAMTRNHQHGQSVFRSILPEDIEWKPFRRLRLPLVSQS